MQRGVAHACWLLKLRAMGTYGVQMKGVLPWLVLWARLAGTRDFILPSLAALVGPVQNILFLAHYHFLCPHRPATWAGSRAGSLVSWYLSVDIHKWTACILLSHIYNCTVWWLASLRIFDPGLLFNFYYKIKLWLEYKIRN